MDLPEKIKTDSGRERNIGLEIEFSGIGPERCIQLLKILLDGTVVNDSAFTKKLNTDEYGTFIVEIDAAFLTEGRYKELLEALGIKLDDIKNRESLEELLKGVASTIVPCEVVMPPIPVTKLDVAEKIVSLLREEKAKGTGSSILYAFGLHINAELASGDPIYILNIIRAYALLYDWICVKSEVDFSRRLTPYINPYPDEYLRLIFAEDYRPDIDMLIDDYLYFVPSRNHALDMLPAFASIDKERVLSRADEPDLIKPRPAFHYRLANCKIDEPDWCIADEWQYWLAIERLSCNETKITRLISAWLEAGPVLPFSGNKWTETVNSIIDQ